MNVQLLGVKHDEVGFFLDRKININVSSERPSHQINVLVVKSVPRSERCRSRPNRIGTTLLGSLTSSIAACISDISNSFVKSGNGTRP